jgi:hypothetical protein
VRLDRLVGTVRVIHCLATTMHANTRKSPALNFRLGDEEAKRRLIADIADLSAEQRGFAPGYELDECLQAEQEGAASMEATAPAAMDVRS